MADILTVDHQHGDGGVIRTVRPDGSRRKPVGGATPWTRYRRALPVRNHGMRLLCANCHLLVTVRRRRAHLAP